MHMWTNMPNVTVELPSLLSALLGGRETVAIFAANLPDALEELFSQIPELRLHLMDEASKLRPHILCFVNETNHRCLEDNAELCEGDVIRIYQAVSGG